MKKVENHKSRKSLHYISKRELNRLRILRMLSEFIPITTIAKILNKSPKTVYKVNSYFIKNGWINKERELTDLGIKKVEKYMSLSNKVEYISNDVSLHNLIYSVKFIKRTETKDFQRLLVLRKIQSKEINKATHKDIQISIKGYKVWLSNNTATFFMGEYVDKTALDCFIRSISDLEQLCDSLQKVLKVKLFEKFLDFKTARNHYALIKNQLAEEYNKEKKKLSIYDDRKELRIIIDNSLRLNEFEAVHQKEARTDNEKVQDWFKDLLEKEHNLPSETKENIKSISQNLILNSRILQEVSNSTFTNQASIFTMIRNIQETQKIIIGKLNNK